MRPLLVSLALLMTAGCSVAAAGPDGGADAMLQRVRTLTDPVLAGRGAGSPGGRAAGDSIAAWLSAVGLELLFEGGWHQEFPLQGEGWSGQSLVGRSGRNVGGVLRGAGRLAGRYVLLCAHYDHLGRSDGDSLVAPPAAADYFPGANDNASGVSVLLEAAATIASTSPAGGDRRSVLVVSFDGEEVGLQGSAFMVDHMPVPLDSLDAVINLDSVGQMPQGKLYVSGIGTTPVFAELARRAGSPDLELALAPGSWSGSDHMTFAAHEVPVIFLFGGPYKEYNRPDDCWESLDPEALAAVARYATDLAGLVRGVPGDMPWVQVADPESNGEGGDEPVHRNTWLGTMPDFTAGITGYMIGSVFEGSPAAAAGLSAGDVLIRFGGQEVTDLATFTRALRSFAPADPVEITLLRGGRPLNFTVVLGDRAQRR